MTNYLRANIKNLSCWSGSGAAFGRWDYRSDDRRLNDILTNHYFGDQTHLLRLGDMITIIDCEDQIMEVRVDFLDKSAHQLHLSRIDRKYALPVVELDSENPDDPGLIWKWRSKNGGGHSIINAKGEIVAINFQTRELAEQAIAIMYKNKAFVAPVGHEPTKTFIKNAPVAPKAA